MRPLLSTLRYDRLLHQARALRSYAPKHSPYINSPGFSHGSFCYLSVAEVLSNLSPTEDPLRSLYAFHSMTAVTPVGDGGKIS